MMSITDRFDPNLFAGKLLPTKTVRDHIFQLLEDYAAMNAQNEYRTPGVFDSAVSLAAGAGNDKVTIGSAARRIVDGIGNTILVPAADSRLTNVPFANEAGEDYYFGLQVGFYPATVGSEPLIEQDVYLQNRYRYFKKTIGRTAHPQSVTLNGNGTLTFNIDNIVARDAAFAGYKGRTAKVWLVAPATSDAAVAVQSLTVENSGSGNTVSTADGAAEAFGQSTPSTSVYDYLVCIEGPEVSRNSDFTMSALTGTFSVAQAVDETWSLTGSGTAFTTELVAGDWIRTATGIPMLVLHVASNTSARVLSGPPGGLAGGQTGTGKMGIFPVGHTAGNGPAQPAAGFSTTDYQKIIEFRFSDLADVIRRDAHGYAKVRVKADGSDADEPQVEVNNAAGNRTFYVNEKGTAKPAVYGTNDYELLQETSRNGSTQKVRTYLYSGVDLVVTVNAQWDQGSGAWDPDVLGDPAMGYLLSDRNFQLLAKDVTTANFAWESIVGWDRGASTYPTMTSTKSGAKGMIFDFPHLVAGDGNANYNLISVLGSGGNGSIRLYHKTNATPKGLCLTVNAEWDGANWDKDVNAAPALRIVLGSDGAEDGSFLVQIENGEADNFADGAWASWLDINEAGAEADFGGLSVRSDQFTSSLASLAVWHYSRVTNANDAVAHKAESSNALALGVARHHEWLNSGADALAWVNHKGGFGALCAHFRDDFDERTLSGSLRWSRSGTGTSEISNVSGFTVGGWVNITTGAVIDDAECLLLDSANWDTDNKPVVLMRVAPGAIATDLVAEVGLLENSTFGADGVYLRRNNSSGNWDLVCRDGGVETAQSTSISAVADTPVLFELVVESSASVKVFVNRSKSPAATVTTNIPINPPLKLGARAQTKTNSIRTLRVDLLETWQDR